MAEFGRQVSDRLARRRRERERVSSVGPTRKMNEGSSSIVKEM